MWRQSDHKHHRGGYTINGLTLKINQTFSKSAFELLLSTPYILKVERISRRRSLNFNTFWLFLIDLVRKMCDKVGGILQSRDHRVASHWVFFWWNTSYFLLQNFKITVVDSFPLNKLQYQLS